jgi:hypothetical protein
MACRSWARQADDSRVLQRAWVLQRAGRRSIPAVVASPGGRCRGWTLDPSGRGVARRSASRVGGACVARCYWGLHASQRICHSVATCYPGSPLATSPRSAGNAGVAYPESTDQRTGVGLADARSVDSGFLLPGFADGHVATLGSDAGTACCCGAPTSPGQEGRPTPGPPAAALPDLFSSAAAPGPRPDLVSSAAAPGPRPDLFSSAAAPGPRPTTGAPPAQTPSGSPGPSFHSGTADDGRIRLDPPTAPPACRRGSPRAAPRAPQRQR